MFEADAEEYYYKTYPVTLNIGEEERKKEVTDIFIKSAEFGYNKANEWHDLRKDNNDLPKENMKQVIVELSDGSYEMGYYCIHNKTWWNNDCPDYDDELGYHDIKNDIHVVPIKWKEII